ncbi:hypothetical protein SDJN02_26081, partial [Cucurbita argyrosperma subsp. argyrosperma]
MQSKRFGIGPISNPALPTSVSEARSSTLGVEPMEETPPVNSSGPTKGLLTQ